MPDVEAGDALDDQGDVAELPDQGADVADAIAADAFDGCATTPGSWCASSGAFKPCGPGQWMCGASACNAGGGCAAGAVCSYVEGSPPQTIVGVVVECAP